MRVAILVLASGCVSSSIGGDLAHVEDLTRLDLPDVEEDVELEPDPELAPLLADALDPDRAARIALLQNRELRARLREIGIARGEWMDASTIPNPVAEAELLPEQQSALELRVEYNVAELLAAPFRASAQAPRVDAARFRAAAIAIDTGARARIDFYALVAAQARLGIARRWLDAFAATRDAAVALEQSGNLSELGRMTREAEYQRGTIRVAEIELEVARRREALIRTLGLHGSDAERLRVPSELPARPGEIELPDDLEATAIRESFELRAKREELSSIARSIGIANLDGWLPDLAVDVHALYADPEVPGESRWRFGAGVSLTVPLFHRREGVARMHAAEFDALLERYVGGAIDARSRAREARAELVSAHARAARYDEVVALDARISEATLREYNAMQINVFALLEARRAVLETELVAVDAARDYFVARTVADAVLRGADVRTERTEPSASSSRSAEEGGH
jgi:outer membrane protein, heavy metal efflux system